MGILQVTLLALAILLVGCGPGDVASEPIGRCDCPNTESIARKIDWLGDGTPPNSIESGSFVSSGNQTPHVQARFKSFTDPGDPLAALGRLVDRLEEAGLAPVVLESQKVQARSGDALVIATASEPFAGDTVLVVDVRISVDDRLAAVALQPFVDALGTID